MTEQRRVFSLGELGKTVPVATADGALMALIARGDSSAFSGLYDLTSARVYGLVRRVVRNPAISEEVCQEVMLEIWRTAAHYDPARGSVTAWVLTIAHRRAIDRVRSEQASTNRDQAVGRQSVETDFDQVSDAVTSSLETEQVRRCLGSLTELQRESITLAYYGGHTYSAVAEMLEANVATVKTRMRDGLLRLRDCLGSEGK
ncbi:ECF RNA polymerase sigma factor SigK [Kribbella sandramycini]|uniref:RNA polymerase sigma-70 factor (ECF subfamily) n=1 Tax=Kribbella sandramycini TaxID=60450 RepID=A0A841SBH4_9ACTN|nr:RNA polymerase sigma-70 factor (ECF subfamily) [Kribbella sandramycini]